ncbi:MAG: hypothetical protein K2M78_13785 [Lachnospiraceae bacterium]|nr:hypothetical protein [Lachnospiraceae bacterium]
MEELLKELESNTNIEKDLVKNRTIVLENCSLLKIRDALYGFAEIISIDEDRNIIVISSKSAKISNIATLAIKVTGNKVVMVGYAKEGMIKQNTVEKEFSRIEKILKRELKVKKKNRWIGLFVSLVILIIFTVVVSVIRHKDGKEIDKIINATNDYNVTVDIYNELAGEYNEKYSYGYFEEFDIPDKIELISRVDNDENNAAKQLKEGNDETKIRKDTESLKELVEINRSLIESIDSYTKPDEENVKKVLGESSSITEIASVTKDNDPNSMLGKEGGYYSCIYFGLEEVQQDLVKGEDIIDKGTDAGGAIELYPTVEDEKNRCEYLAQFDGSVLTTGSYTLVGTMVIRLSYQLSGEKQNEITKKIIEGYIK